MTYSAQEKSDVMTGRMTRLNGGSMELLGGAGQVVAVVPLNNPSGTVSSTTLTFGGFPKTVTPALTGVAIASAQLKDSGGAVRKSGITTGLSGSGAQVILSKTTPAVGDMVTVAAPLTLTDL